MGKKQRWRGGRGEKERDAERERGRQDMDGEREGIASSTIQATSEQRQPITANHMDAESDNISKVNCYTCF